jgi:hypothetical protein
VTYRCGLIEEATVSARALLRHGDRLFASAPVPWLKIVDAAGVGELATCPHLAGVESLDLSNNRLMDREIAPILTEQPWVRLAELNLRGNRSGVATLAALASAPRLARLRHIDLSHIDVVLYRNGDIAAVRERFGEGLIV